MYPNPPLGLMEIESSCATIRSNKLWNKLKIVLYMLRKTLAKTKLLVDLHIKLKDRKLAYKAFTTLLVHHHQTAITCGGCTSNNIDTLFISPHKHKLQINGRKCKSYNYHDDDMIERVAFEIFNINGGAAIEPPSKGPVSCELRVNESLLGDEEETQVDKAAEAFIKKFYNQLKQQHISCVESPSPNHLWAQ